MSKPAQLKSLLPTTYNLQPNSGFTLIEMMIVISIFVIMSTGAVINYRAFNQRQQALQSAKNLQEAFRLAQKKARVGDKPTGCQTLNGYLVTGTTSSTTITITADCTNQDYQVSTAQLIGNARLQSNVSVTFRVISGGVVGSGTIRTVVGSYIYAFDVNKGGEITEGQYE